MKNIQKFENFETNNKPNQIVELDGWAITETIEEGYAGNYDGLIKDDELANELSDAGKLISNNQAITNDVVIPLNSSVAFPIGTRILVQQLGTGRVVIASTPGVTLTSRSGFLYSIGQYSVINLIKRDTNTWLVYGDISAL